MYQVLPFKNIVLAFATITIAIVAFLEWGEAVSGLQMSARYALTVISALLLLLAWKPVWRTAWKFIPILRQWFPDINGEYEVVLQHNWPIQQKLLEAASAGLPFDPRHPEADIPALGTAKLKAKIDLGFYSIRMTMWSETTKDGQVIIDRSRSISTTLIRPCDGHPHRLAYTYQQVNRREKLAPSDDAIFEGCAILNIEDFETGEMQGQYWTNRAWHRGLSTAGNIVLKRVADR